MEKNIPKFYWYRLTKFALFHIAIMVLFYEQRGLSFSRIMILQSFYYFAKVLSEVPTGALADRFGRKKSLVIGSFCHSSAYLLIFLSHSFILFNLGEIIAGISMSFAYGADSALAYDTLKDLGREKEYQKVEGNGHSMRLLSFAIFAPIGGLLATINLALPYLASSIIIFFSGLLALTFTEPLRVRVGVVPPPLSRTGVQPLSEPKSQVGRKYYHEIIRSFNLMLEEKKILWLVLFFSLVFLATRLGFWTYQPYLKEVGVPLSLFGVVFASFHLFAALVSKYADKIEKTLKENLTLLFMPVLVIISFILMSRFLFLWSVCFILLQQASMATHEPILKSYLNRLAPSDIRATMLSVQSMAGNLVFAVTAPFLGSFVDKFGLGNALLIFALVIIIFSIFLWYCRKRWFTERQVI
ncbi:MAG: MFS transporter [candidate division Zixibacteria bacterium]|nr:MFS transporter [candidate division Zixibacteria bacterium]